MIYEYSRANGACEAVQGLSTLFSTSLQNDDVPDFDIRWDHALLPVSEMPSDMILEGLYKSKLQNSVQLQTVLALYDQETARSKEPNHFLLKTAVKLHIDQMVRTRNFMGPARCCGTGISHQESKRKESQRRKESVRVFPVEGTWTMFPEETHASFSGNNDKGQRRKERSSSPASHSKAKTDWRRGAKNPHRDQAVNRKALWTRVKFHADSNSVKIRHVNSGIFPWVLNHKSEQGCVHGDICHCRHFEAEGKPSKKSKKGGAKRSVSILKVSAQLGCVFEDSYPRKFILCEQGRLGSKHTVNFSKGTWHQSKIRERKGPSRGIIPKS